MDMAFDVLLLQPDLQIAAAAIAGLVAGIAINLLDVVGTGGSQHRIVHAVLVIGDTVARRALVRLMTVGSVAWQVLIAVIVFVVNEDPLVLREHVTGTMVKEGQGVGELTMTIGHGLMTLLLTDGDIRVTGQMTEQRGHSNTPGEGGNEDVIVRGEFHNPLGKELFESEIEMRRIGRPSHEDGRTGAQPSRGPFGVALHGATVQLALGHGVDGRAWGVATATGPTHAARHQTQHHCASASAPSTTTLSICALQ